MSESQHNSKKNKLLAMYIYPTLVFFYYKTSVINIRNGPFEVKDIVYTISANDKMRHLDLSDIIITVFSISLIVHSTRGLPAYLPRWQQPCAGSTPLPQSSITLEDARQQTHAQMYRSISQHASETKAFVMELLDRYVSSTE